MTKEEKIDPIKFREGNISLILDSYNDLFSDFDPRHYSMRALSDDFLIECKKAAVVKKDSIEIRFLVPKNKRNYSDEAVIKRRLKDFFHKHYKEQETEIKKIKREGIFWFIAGTLIMLLSSFLLIYPGFWFKFLFIMTEPAGWFFFWEGLGKFFISAKKEMPNFEFYKKMVGSEIFFHDY